MLPKGFVPLAIGGNYNTSLTHTHRGGGGSIKHKNPFQERRHVIRRGRRGVLGAPPDWRSRNKRGLRFNPHSTSLLPSVQIASCTFTRGSGALTVLLLLHSPRDPLRFFPPPLSGESLGSFCHWICLSSPPPLLLLNSLCLIDR